MHRLIGSALALSTAAAFIFLGSPAKADIFVSFDGSSDYTSFTGASSGVGAGSFASAGSSGLFSGTFSATGNPPLSGDHLFDTNTINFTSSGPGTLTLYITETGLSGPVPSFLSSFTTNELTGWTVTEQTFASATDAKYTGTALSSAIFTTSNQTLALTALVPMTGTYSLTALYTIFAPGAGDSNDTININANVVPIPGALPLFASGVLGLWAVGRKRKAKKVSTAIAAA